MVHTNTLKTSRLPTTQYESRVYIEVPQFMGTLNTCKLCTHYVEQCWEQVPQEFRITLIVMRDWNRWKFLAFLFRATEHSYGESYDFATETTFTISGARHSCNVPRDRFSVVSFTAWVCNMRASSTIISLLSHTTFYFSTCDLRTNPHKRAWNFATKRLDALGSLKHVSFDISTICISSQRRTPFWMPHNRQRREPNVKI